LFLIIITTILTLNKKEEKFGLHWITVRYPQMVMIITK